MRRNAHAEDSLGSLCVIVQWQLPLLVKWMGLPVLSSHVLHMISV